MTLQPVPTRASFGLSAESSTSAGSSAPAAKRKATAARPRATRATTRGTTRGRGRVARGKRAQPTGRHTYFDQPGVNYELYYTQVICQTCRTAGHTNTYQILHHTNSCTIQHDIKQSVPQHQSVLRYILLNIVFLQLQHVRQHLVIVELKLIAGHQDQQQQPVRYNRKFSFIRGKIVITRPTSKYSIMR